MCWALVDERHWWRITAYPDCSLVDRVADVFVRFCGGAAVEDPALVDRVAPDGSEEVAPDLRRPARPVVKGFLPAGKRLARRRLLAALAGFEPRPKVVTGFIQATDWESNWKKYYHVHRVGRRLVVVPAWEAYTAAPGEITVRLDPGPAFGTGTHPSTELCLELLEEEDLAGATVADVGTGSGILAVAAALLGASRILAVDSDPVAVRMAAGNADLNEVRGFIEFYVGDLLAPVTGEVFNLVTANLTAGLLVGLAPLVGDVLKEGGRLIASGIIVGRADEVRAAFAREGLLVLREMARGEWVAFLACRGRA